MRHVPMNPFGLLMICAAGVVSFGVLGAVIAIALDRSLGWITGPLGGLWTMYWMCSYLDAPANAPDANEEAPEA